MKMGWLFFDGNIIDENINKNKFLMKLSLEKISSWQNYH